jgi:hypothetical protein
VADVDFTGITVARIPDEPQGRARFRCGNPEMDRWLRDDAVVVDRLPGFRVTAATEGTRVVGCYLFERFPGPSALVGRTSRRSTKSDGSGRGAIGTMGSAAVEGCR